MAGFTDNLELLGISTVCGNQTVDKTTINALKICQISGLGDIPVVKGQHKALTREERACPGSLLAIFIFSNIICSIN